MSKDKEPEVIVEEEYKEIAHPMEDVLDIEPGTTLVPHQERSTELVVSDEMDTKDEEIDGQFQEVYDAAMTAFDQQSQDSEVIEPKYRARNQEVAVQFLNTALNAAQQKSTLKQHKDKLSVAKVRANNAGTTNNNLIVADRNEILKHIQGSGEE